MKVALDSSLILRTLVALIDSREHALIQDILKAVKTAYDSADTRWQALADQGYKIEAIKEHRHVYGSSLKDAKDAVFQYLGLPD